MTAQPEYTASDQPAPQIPHTINAIGGVLVGENRARFYGEVLAADESDVAAVMRRWWMRATLDAAPGATESRANAHAGRNLVSLDDLMERVDTVQ
ncbi:hypothetical protein SRB5_11320 [Streptomyces sp. RB5]|uniref:Uncharacterized protein n=1 Tax=Streptomyces smaragdinus TaxID=2585196 RepID=A0A7K0CC51_9ACTN|nr:hypothetical protein [Streptomyces smaragdinus]MQY11018.1 hypothetical protein [Streptomyces smaragdinus]